MTRSIARFGTLFAGLILVIACGIENRIDPKYELIAERENFTTKGIPVIQVKDGDTTYRGEWVSFSEYEGSLEEAPEDRSDVDARYSYSPVLFAKASNFAPSLIQRVTPIQGSSKARVIYCCEPHNTIEIQLELTGIYYYDSTQKRLEKIGAFARGDSRDEIVIAAKEALVNYLGIDPKVVGEERK